MKYIRKGNDISVKWSLYSDAGELSLEGRSIRLFLKNAYGRKELEDYTISGNAILWTFYGKDQKSTGKHSLELIINEGLEGMITTDACDFVELVSCSKPSASEDDPNIETQSIELRSQLDYSTGEGSAIVVDDMLSETSINPVQNRVITAELQKKIDAEALEARINLEHIYFLYKQNENCVYYKGIDTFEFQELLPWTLNVAIGKPLTPHFIIQDDENQRILSSNKFEITSSPLGLQWQYNDLLYTLIYDNGQSITTSPIPSGSSAIPDWDAQEGEAGFIKNRTHYVNGFLITAAGNYGSASRNIIYKGNTYTLPEDGTKLQLEIGPPVYAYYQRESGQIYVESVSPDYLETYPIKVVEEIVPLADLYIPDTIARKSELTELSAEVGKRNVGAEDTDESVEEPNIPAPSGSNEWKCVYDGRMAVGTNLIEIESELDGTALKAEEMIMQVLMDSKADSSKNGYVYVKSTTNTQWNAFGVIDFQNTSATESDPYFSQFHLKTSPIMYAVGEIYNKMAGAINNNVEIKAGIGDAGPQIYEDITYIRVVTNGDITTPPLIKIFVR